MHTPLGGGRGQPLPYHKWVYHLKQTMDSEKF